MRQIEADKISIWVIPMIKYPTADGVPFEFLPLNKFMVRHLSALHEFIHLTALYLALLARFGWAVQLAKISYSPVRLGDQDLNLVRLMSLFNVSLLG